jgi:DNA-binding transcriptional regulator YhcF (GntR family)
MDTDLDRSTGIPLYVQLVDRILQLVERAELEPGAQLSSEHDLQKIFGVSRATVREALRRLEADGFVTRQQGRGTFLVERPPSSTGLRHQPEVAPAARPPSETHGLQLFARYAYPPNERGFCGPPEHRTLLEYGASGASDPGLKKLALAFSGPWPYLKLLAGAAGISDPFDYRVVEAYWLGNRLLDAVDMSDFGAALTERFRPRTGPKWGYLAEAIPAGAVAHHSFHVFGVYPWVGLLSAERGEPLQILDRCRIRWGRVISVEQGRVTLRSRPLTWDGRKLDLGAPRIETATLGVDGLGFVDDLRSGEWISLHWRWVCDRLTRRQLTNLRCYTLRHLDMINHRLRHPGPAMLLG